MFPHAEPEMLEVAWKMSLHSHYPQLCHGSLVAVEGSRAYAVMDCHNSGLMSTCSIVLLQFHMIKCRHRK